MTSPEDVLYDPPDWIRKGALPLTGEPLICVPAADLRLVLEQCGFLPYPSGQAAQRRLNAIVPGLRHDLPWIKGQLPKYECDYCGATRARCFSAGIWNPCCAGCDETDRRSHGV